MNVNMIRSENYGPSKAEEIALKEVGGTTERRKIRGVVEAIIPDSTKLGPFLRFVGRFEMVRGTDTFEAPELILPGRAERTIEALYNAPREKGEPLPIRIDIWMEHDEPAGERQASPTGYTWRHERPSTASLASKMPAF